MGILIAMNEYVIRKSKIKLDESLFSGSILGVLVLVLAVLR